MSTNETKSEEAGAKSNTGPVIGVVFVVVALAIAAIVMITGNGEAENKTSNVKQEDIKAANANPDAPKITLGNPVVAVVNGENVMRSDVLAFIGNLPEQVRQMPIQTLFPLALDQVVNNKIVSAKAAGAKLDDDAEVKKMVEDAKGNIIRSVFVERQVNERVTEKKVVDAYQDLLTKLQGVKEVRARHILVPEEETAKELVKKLDDGADFAELATENSTGPSAPRGGDLGYFAKGEMVPEFSDAAFALDVGAYTKDPVKTQFGWHVIKVEEKRDRPEPKYETVKPQLEQQLRQQVMAELLQEWQKDAKIKKYDINGEPVKESN